MSATKIFFVGAGAIVLILIVASIFGLFGLGWERKAAPFREETRAITYDTSRQYQQGTNREVARYCEQMHSAPSPSARRAVAALIRSTISTYDGPLSVDNRQCVADARAN